MPQAETTEEILNGPNNQFKQPKQQYFLKTHVTSIERAPKKDPIIRFDAQTNLPGFRTTQFRDVRRTHHEFQKLADHLIIENPECLVPALYPSSTSFGAGTEEDERRMKLNMQHWLDLVCENPVIIRDKEMIHFVESDFGWSPVLSRGKPATGLKRRAIKQLQPPPDDTPELINARPIAKAFYVQTSDCQSKLHRVTKERTNLALAEQEFARRLSTLAQGETHPGMSNALEKLGRTLQSVSDAHSLHVTLEAATLEDALSYHARDAYIVKETLTTRQITIRELNQAQNTSRTKQANASRMKSSTNLQPTKVDDALSSLEEAKALEQTLNTKLNRMTANLLIENRSWLKRTAKELQSSLREYTRRQIDSERRVLAMLEAVRPEIRSIDGSGGLSRLGRTNLQRARSQVGPSQTPDGDSWSGVKRTKAYNANTALAAATVPNVSSIKEHASEPDKLDAKSLANVL